MPRYIDVERFCREICRCAGLENGCDKSKCPIWNAPAEDVVPARDGEIIKSMKRAGDSAKNVTESLNNVIDAFENAEHCVCCGDVIPEGRQICMRCEKGEEEDV